MKSFLSVLAGLTFLYAFFPYIRAIMCEETRPRKATWLIWMLGDVITVAGMLAKHTISGQLVAAIIGAGTVFLLSLKYGESGWTKRDKICISIAVLAIVSWQYLGESNAGVALGLFALVVAAWPTYVSAWEKPENEDRKGWIIFEISSLLAVLAIPHWTFANYAPPIVFLSIDTPMMYLLCIRPFFKRRAVQTE